MVKVDLSGAKQFFTGAGPDYALAALCHETLVNKSGLGADFLRTVDCYIFQSFFQAFSQKLPQLSQSFDFVISTGGHEFSCLAKSCNGRYIFCAGTVSGVLSASQNQWRIKRAPDPFGP